MHMKSAHPRAIGPYLLVSLGLLAPEAWAYLDPSTGSMILSAIVGMFATAALALKTYWYKLKNLFRRQDEDKRKDQSPAQDSRPAAD
jgi:multisubunit Na+/H+ antiporter MnhC subunit